MKNQADERALDIKEIEVLITSTQDQLNEDEVGEDDV